MRFPVPLVIVIPDGQIPAWALRLGVHRGEDGRVRARYAVDGVRAQVLAVLRADFERLGVDAEITVR